MIYALANITNFTILFLTMITVLTLMNSGYTIISMITYVFIDSNVIQNL